MSLWLGLGLSITFNSNLCLMSVLKHASSITHCFWRNVFFSFVFVSHSYYKVFSLQCLLFALAYWNVVFLKPVHFKVWLSFLLQANGACFMNLIWSRHHFLMLKVIVKEKPTLVDQSNVPNIWFQWVDKLLMFGVSKTYFLAFVVD